MLHAGCSYSLPDLPVVFTFRSILLASVSFTLIILSSSRLPNPLTGKPVTLLTHFLPHQ